MFILTTSPQTASWLTTDGIDGHAIGKDLAAGRVRLDQADFDELLDLDSDTDGTVQQTGPQQWTLYEDGSAWPISLEPGAAPDLRPRCRSCGARDGEDSEQITEVRRSSATGSKPDRYCGVCLDRYGPDDTRGYIIAPAAR